MSNKLIEVNNIYKKNKELKGKKILNAFAFLTKRGSVVIKKRFKLFCDDKTASNWNDWLIQLSKNKSVSMADFKGRWVLSHDKNITKEEAKKLICESLFQS